MTSAQDTRAGTTLPPGTEGDRPAQGARKQSWRDGVRRGDWRPALLFLSPWVVGFTVFTAWPVIYTGYLSLTDYDVLTAPSFVGLENYQRLVQDQDALRAMNNTMVYTVLQVPLYVVFSLMLALLLNQVVGRTAGIFRTVFFLPSMTPPVATGVLLLLLFNGQDGLLNEVLAWFGINGPNWTTDPFWIKPGLVLMSLLSVGGSVIILFAALRGVPQDLYDAAFVDGAGFWRRTWHVTIPMISGALFFVVVVNTIAALQSFTEAYTAFFGVGNTTYSNEAAELYAIHVFRQAFEFLHMGYASALAWLLFLVIMVITAVQVVVSRRLVFYEGGAR
ncbi:carbohydrate ABC transporter permease [Ornithinimicrobium avium]|uniref:Sugar ABC transporter permease n=1 Tax=Ornithinimicrobium avium TaxID=2283195 RepID=A0A345NKL2_9MICO|nr:sugar ABC transporter permease [Ornithinimicrobium avium]AXH95570.1 sugar ABC transporter permease [Ornithinimicrobium avium]